MFHCVVAIVFRCEFPSSNVHNWNLLCLKGVQSEMLCLIKEPLATAARKRFVAFLTCNRPPLSDPVQQTVHSLQLFRIPAAKTMLFGFSLPPFCFLALT